MISLSLPKLPHWLRSPRAGGLAALVLGALIPLAFSPFDLWPFAVLAPAGLFLLWRSCTPRAGLWRGWLFGFGMWGAGVYWIHYSLHLFGDAIAPLAAVLTVLFAAGMALTLGILGWLVCRTGQGRRDAAWFLLILPAAWIALEWVRSWLMTGFPWLLTGTVALDTPLAGYAPVVGVYGIGLLLALAAGALAGAAAAGYPRAVLVPTVIAVTVWLGGMVLDGREWTRPGGPPVEVALVQGNIDQTRKFGTLESTLDRYMELTRAVAGEAELVLWPETAIPTFYSKVDDRMNAFAEAMRRRGTDVVSGVFVHDDDSGRYYNSIRPLGPDRNDYRKHHLVPFGEYLPLRGALAFAERFIRIPMSDIAAGARHQPPLAVGGHALGATICYEAAYPETLRALAPASGMLINVSNDAWFGDSTAPAQHLQMARMRSLETGRPMLRSTNTGISAVIDHHGRITAVSPPFTVNVLRASAQPRQDETPWVRWGSMPVLVVAGLMLAAGIAARTRT